MRISEIIGQLEKRIKNPKVGLPEEVFLFATRITPMVNVDLLIKDEKGRTLLAWRKDKYHENGWHVPGGIIRIKENWEDRVKKVAKSEIGVMVNYNPVPIALNQFIKKQESRGHFISILFRCFLPSSFKPQNLGLKSSDGGYLKWHKKCPKNLLDIQQIYKKYL